MAAIDIDIDVRAADWGDIGELETLSATAVLAAADYLEQNGGQPFPDPATELSLVFTSDAEIRAPQRPMARQGQADQRAVLPGLSC